MIRITKSLSSKDSRRCQTAALLLLILLASWLSMPAVIAQERQLNLVFPQYASGFAGGMENRTRIILRNNGERTETGKVTFLTSSGNMAQISVGGEEVGFINYSIEPWGVIEIQTDGTGPLNFGPIEVVSELGSLSTLDGTIVFELLGNLVSVSSSPLRSSHQTFVSVNESENSGLALYNPDLEKAATLGMTLLDNKGDEAAVVEFSLPPGRQRAVFVDDADLFAEFFEGLENPFIGTLHIIASQGEQIGVLGLIQRASDGALLSVPVSDQVIIKPASTP